MTRHPVVVLPLAVLAALALGAAALVLLVWWGHERVVWQPPRGPFPGPGAGAGVRRVDYAAADGQPLYGYLAAPPRGTPARVLLVFHGNAETAADGVVWAREAARRPGGLLVVPGASHVDLPFAGGARYWAFLEQALAEALGRAGA